MNNFGIFAHEQQARFRSCSKSISDKARNPVDDVGRKHGHLLASGCEQENLFPKLRGMNGALSFFKDRIIKWWQSTRSGDTPGLNIPTRNLASSQIACVNFLMPLKDNPQAIIAMIKGINPDVENIIPIEYTANNKLLQSLVEFEWMGLDKSLENKTVYYRGANATSVDALVIAQTNRAKRAYLFEWKYSEQYSGAEYKGKGNSGDKRRKSYKHLYESESSAFSGIVPFEELLFEPFYQIMRLQLLADKMIKDGIFNVTEAMVVSVCPDDNMAYRQTITSPLLKQRFPSGNVEFIIKASLRNPEARFKIISPQALFEPMYHLRNNIGLEDWISYHKERYEW